MFLVNNILKKVKSFIPVCSYRKIVYICSKQLKIMINIDAILREKGLNKTELTKKMGFKQRLSLYNILNGNPTLENIEKLAEALEVPVSRLFPSEVSGYLEIRGRIYKISSKTDIENALAALD